MVQLHGSLNSGAFKKLKKQVVVHVLSGAEVAQFGRALDSTTSVVGGEAEDRVVAGSSPALGTTIKLNFEDLLQGGLRITMFETSTLFVFFAVVNFVALVFFGVDKLKSKRRSWRVPESRLLLVAFFGPFGAYAGMLVFRHKTRKVKFLLVPVFFVCSVGFDSVFSAGLKHLFFNGLLVCGFIVWDSPVS